MSRKISCLIIEDEPPAMQLLEDYIQKLPLLNLKGKFYDAIEALDYLRKNTVEVIFLDINLPALSGLEMAALIPKEQKIIFTTAYAQHAFDSFSFHVVDYLLKPVSFGRFLQAIQKLHHYTGTINAEREERPKEQDLLFIKTGRKVVSIRYTDILYLEAHKEYLCIHTVQQKHLVYKRMKEMALGLPSQFIRIHNSYIVNLQHLENTAQQTVIIAGKVLPVSNTYKDGFQDRLKQFIL